MNITMNVHIGLIPKDVEIRNNFVLTFNMEHVKAALKLMLRANKDR